MIQLMAETTTTNSTGSIISTITSLVSSITGIAGSGWAGVAAMSLASLLAVGGGAILFGMLAKYLNNKIYTGDIDLSNSSAGKEAVEAGQADDAAKQDAAANLANLHNTLEKMETESIDKPKK